MEGQYAIYKLTSPSGKMYIGLTKMSIRERWQKHIHRAFNEQRNHPLYNAIRKYGPGAFQVERLGIAANKSEAQAYEMAFIEFAPTDRLYNISPGGEADGETGSARFWGTIRENPSEFAAYLEKLSNVKKSRDWTDYDHLTSRAQEWRKDNPREAYKLAYRGIRLARRATGFQPKEDTRPLKERLLWKHKRGAIIRQHTTELWKRRSDDEKKAVGEKISIALKEKWRESAVLPDFNPNHWPFAKATVLRKIRQGMTREEIIDDAIRNVRSKGSHWREVKQNLIRMGVRV